MTASIETILSNSIPADFHERNLRVPDFGQSSNGLVVEIPEYSTVPAILETTIQDAEISNGRQERIAADASAIGSISFSGAGIHPQTLRALERFKSIADTPGHKHRHVAGALYKSYTQHFGP